MKRLAVLIAMVALLMPSQIATAAGTDAYDPNRVPIASDQIMMTLEELGRAVPHSTLQAERETSGGGFQERVATCKSPTDERCDPTKVTGNLMADVILPHCSTTTQEFCVESLDLAPAGGELKPATFLRNATSDWSWAPDTSTGLLQGSGAALFSASNMPDTATSLYAVTVVIKQSLNPVQKKFGIGDVTVTVQPYREPDTPAGGGNFSCVFLEGDKCGMLQSFSEGTVAKVSVRLPNSVGGWFRGRLKDPTVDVQRISNSANRIVVTGQAVTVPRFALVRSKATHDADEWYHKEIHSWWGTSVGVAAGGPSEGENGFKYLERFRESVKDTSGGETTFWSMKTAPAGQGSNCLADSSKVLGLVTTNSMVYDATAPQFTNGSLNYKVAGLHYLPDAKTLAIGTYDLVLRSDIARCLYGFSNAPLQASISIVGGTDQVATTVVSEKDGWLKLAAYGFTFSEKSISVKLSQQAPAPTVVAKPAAKAKSTITCVKGKTTKKVTGTKYPSGWRKR